MDDDIKDLTFSRTKKCDSCGYCTQMDKSGTRKPPTIALENKGQKAGKCPLFPNLTWRYIDDEEVKRIQKLFDFAENVLYQNK
jgi:Fe-S-cluster containining protein